MDKEKKDYISIDDIDPQGKLAHSIRYKPVLGTLLMFIFGVLALLTNTFIGITSGILFMVASLLALFVVKDKKVLDIYANGIVAYADEDDSLAVYIPYRSIVTWKSSRSTSGTQVVVFALCDDTYIYKETFRIRNIRRFIKKHIPDKEFIKE